MESQYWIQREGKTTGPFSDEQFAQMTATDMIVASDLISTDQVNWTVAENLPCIITPDTSGPDSSGQDGAVLTHSTEDRSGPVVEVSADNSSVATGNPPQQTAPKPSRDISQRPQCTIHKAVSAGDVEQVKLHLAWGTDVNAVDQGGNSPLHYANHFFSDGGTQSSKTLSVAELLLANGADVNSKGDYDQTPLLRATMHSDNSSKELVELLLAMGADVNTEDRRGQTPLTYANSADIVEVLLANRARESACDNDRRGSLHHYAEDGNTEVAERFLRIVTPDPPRPMPWWINHRDKHGKTPLELAEKGSEVAALLKSFGAKRSPLWYRGPLTPRIVRGAIVASLMCGVGVWQGYFVAWPVIISFPIGGFLAGYFLD